MPTGPIDNKGSELYFTDSGPVPGSSDYTTLVIYHGSAFNGDTFHKILPFAARDNVRLVILNRRQYHGSTKYTDEELEELRQGKKAFLERLGQEVAYFLIWFAEKYNIPKISPDQKSGGIATLGWSLGTCTPIALLGHPDVIPAESYAKLEPYFRQLIIYDSPHLAFGYSQPEEGYNPFTDPTLKSPEEVFSNFSYWVSSYYDHPGFATRDTKALDFRRRGDNPSVDNMNTEEMSAVFDGAAAGAMEFPMYFNPMQPTIKVQADTALWDVKLAQTVLPKTKIVWLACEKTNWYCTWGLYETERLYKEHVAKGDKVRPIRFIEVPGANHFVHWDDPVAFWAATVDALHN